MTISNTKASFLSLCKNEEESQEEYAIRILKHMKVILKSQKETFEKFRQSKNWSLIPLNDRLEILGFYDILNDPIHIVKTEFYFGKFLKRD